MANQNRLKPVIQSLFLAAIIGFIGWGFLELDLTSLIFKNQETARPMQTMTAAQYREVSRMWEEQQKAGPTEKTEPIAPFHNEERNNNQVTPHYPPGTIFTYTNKNGLITMVDDIEKVPGRYRNQMKISKGSSGQQRTPVEVVNNQVYVPVTLTYQGKTITARLLLDTGATGITISPALAQRLGARPTSQGSSTLADGRKVQTWHFTCDQISVGSKHKEAAVVSIIPRDGTEETGLLGMSFLADFPHILDLQAKAIKWL